MSLRTAMLFTPHHSAEHVAMLAEVEHLAWNSPGEHIAATSEKIDARLCCFSGGVTLATLDGRAAGSQYAFRTQWNGVPEALTTWDEMTCHGWYDRVHSDNGNTGFLVGVGVVPHFRGEFIRHNLRWQGAYKLSELLIARTLEVLFSVGVSSVIGCARLPLYHHFPEYTVEQYCALRRPANDLVDPVLRFHERMGARLIRPVNDAMEDLESLNAGCWVVYHHPFAG